MLESGIIFAAGIFFFQMRDGDSNSLITSKCNPYVEISDPAQIDKTYAQIVGMLDETLTL